jgi:non-ribosomal peptide synthetase component F
MSALLQNLVARQAAQRPDAVAVVFNEARLTYGDMEAQSNRVARRLREAGVRPGDRVCFLAPKSPLPLVWMLGILKGAIHVPLDPASPAARLQKIIDACEPRRVLTADEPFTDGDSDAPLEPAARPEDPAHILFTSGSTGVPKGVVITHACVMAFVEWGLAHFGLDATDRVSGYTPLHFDLSTYDIFGAYAAGAELHLVPPETALLPHRLARFIREAGLTQWFSVPSVLNYLAKADAVAHGDFPSLRRIMWCGEVLPTPALIHWMRRVPHARFTNLYGPTEATIASSYYDVAACPESPASASTAPATSAGRVPTACSSWWAAPTPRSRAAATASSWARSRPRSPRCRCCARAPWSPSHPTASSSGRSAAPTCRWTVLPRLQPSCGLNWVVWFQIT